MFSTKTQEVLYYFSSTPPPWKSLKFICHSSPNRRWWSLHTFPQSRLDKRKFSFCCNKEVTDYERTLEKCAMCEMVEHLYNWKSVKLIGPKAHFQCSSALSSRVQTSYWTINNCNPNSLEILSESSVKTRTGGKVIFLKSLLNSEAQRKSLCFVIREALSLVTEASKQSQLLSTAIRISNQK